MLNFYRKIFTSTLLIVLSIYSTEVLSCFNYQYGAQAGYANANFFGAQFGGNNRYILPPTDVGIYNNPGYQIDPSWQFGAGMLPPGGNFSRPLPPPPPVFYPQVYTPGAIAGNPLLGADGTFQAGGYPCDGGSLGAAFGLSLTQSIPGAVSAWERSRRSRDRRRYYDDDDDDYDFTSYTDTGALYTPSTQTASVVVPADNDTDSADESIREADVARPGPEAVAGGNNGTPAAAETDPDAALRVVGPPTGEEAEQSVGVCANLELLLTNYNVNEREERNTVESLSQGERELVCNRLDACPGHQNDKVQKECNELANSEAVEDIKEGTDELIDGLPTTGGLAPCSFEEFKFDEYGSDLLKGALRILVNVYQDCGALNLVLDEPPNGLDGLITTETTTHTFIGKDQKEYSSNIVMRNLAKENVEEYVANHPYLSRTKLAGQVSSCVDVHATPSIFSYGAKYASTGDRLGLHGNLGASCVFKGYGCNVDPLEENENAASVTGVDCSGFVHSAFLAGGLRLYPEGNEDADKNVNTYKLANLGDDSPCVDNVEADSDFTIKPGDIVTLPGEHTFIIHSVDSDDPLGIKKSASNRNCEINDRTDFDFAIIQSGSLLNSLGVAAIDQKLISTSIKGKLEAKARKSCCSLVEDSSNTPGCDNLAPDNNLVVGRHTGTPECQRPIKEIENEGCVGTCLKAKGIIPNED